MLDFDKLRELYEVETGYTLFHDYGELQDAQRAHREKNTLVYPVFGLFATTPAQLTPVKGAFVGTVTANITVLCRPDKIDEVRQRLNDTAVRLNGTTGEIDGYTYTYNTETCYVGEEIRDNMMDYTVPVYQSITYSIVEGGVSSYAVKVTIDGFPVPSLSVTQTRTKTSSTYAGDDMVGRVGVQLEAYGVDIAVPWLTDGIVGVLQRECAEATRGIAHAVEIDNNGEITAYLMVCGNIVTTAQPPLNVGLTISMVEALPEASRIPSWWVPFTTEKRVVSVNADGTPRTVLWGDGTGCHVDGFSWHRYAEEGTHTGYIIAHMASPDYLPITEGVDLTGRRLRISKDSPTGILTDADMVKTTNGGTEIQGGRLYMVDGTDMIPIDRDIGYYGITKGTKIEGILSGKVTQAGTILEYDRNG